MRTKYLKNALQQLKKTFSAKSLLPALHSVLLESAGGRLTLTTSDLESTGRLYVDNKGGPDFKTLIEVIALEKLLGKLDDWIELHFSEGILSIFDGTITARLKQSVDLIEFPPPTFVEYGALLDPICYIGANVLRQALREVRNSVSTEEDRPQLMKVFVEIKNGAATFAAANGFRLSQSGPHACVATEATDVNFLLPTSAISLLDSTLPQNGLVLIAGKKKENRKRREPVYDAVALLVEDTVRVSVFQQDEEFPDYRQVIPTFFNVEPVTIRTTVSQWMRVTRPMDNHLTINLNGDVSLVNYPNEWSKNDDSGLELSAVLPALVEGDISQLNNDDGKAGFTFDLRQFRPLLAEWSGKDDTLTIQISNRAAPLRITNAQHPDVLHVLMPVHR